ncbi:MAG: phage tail assembly protein [Flavobacteriales bacterium]
MSTEKVKLSYPVDVDGVEVDTLHVRRMKVRDIKNISKIKDTTESTIALLSALCSVPPESIEQLDMEDLATLSDKVEKFMGISMGKSEA